MDEKYAINKTAPSQRPIIFCKKLSIEVDTATPVNDVDNIENTDKTVNNSLAHFRYRSIPIAEMIYATRITYEA
jgi:hypothetical protein